MSAISHISPDDIRASFAAALSAMYREEVPAYGALCSLVERVNKATLEQNPELEKRLRATDSLERISDERHGAVRLGTEEELSTIRRMFGVMGMHPVGYYDLSVAGVPVHSTAFRPVDPASLRKNPFRVFTSLLRLDLLEDKQLGAEARAILASRKIFTKEALSLLDKAEKVGGLSASDSERFVQELLETFRWHDSAVVGAAMYERLHDAHRLVADVVSFRGPHINHLTPRTLDIDSVQRKMPEEGIAPKAVIEGPPTRKCPILLRQTSFKALEEPISFARPEGGWEPGAHTARFGEIEQRGAALTPKGRALYDKLLAEARSRVRPAADGSNAAEYTAALAESFAQFPDNWDELREEGLCYFQYSLADGNPVPVGSVSTIEEALQQKLVQFDPIVYEDFLPVSAAGIFQSNLGDNAAQGFTANPNRALFEQQLGSPVQDDFAHYANAEQVSIDACLSALKQATAHREQM